MLENNLLKKIKDLVEEIINSNIKKINKILPFKKNKIKLRIISKRNSNNNSVNTFNFKKLKAMKFQNKLMTQ